MPITSDGPAPYTAPKAIIDLIQAYRARGLQTPFTHDVLVKAGVSETLAPRTLQAIKQLGLVDAKGEPTPQLVDLRKAPEAEFKERFAAIVRDVYGEVLSYVDPATDPPDRIRDAFRSYTPVGQQGRMVTLFLGLCEYAGMIPQNPERPRRVAGGAATRGPRRETVRPPAETAPTERVGASLNVASLFQAQPAAAGGHQLVQGLLRELPPVGAKWPRTKYEAWLDLQRAVFNVLYEIEDNGQPSLSTTKGGSSD